jgi:hypothetical protein
LPGIGKSRDPDAEPFLDYGCRALSPACRKILIPHVRRVADASVRIEDGLRKSTAVDEARAGRDNCGATPLGIDFVSDVPRILAPTGETGVAGSEIDDFANSATSLENVLPNGRDYRIGSVDLAAVKIECNSALGAPVLGQFIERGATGTLSC